MKGSNLKKNTLGKRGEDIAACFLQEKGYQIVRRNFCSKEGEIDIIAATKGCLVFVEVKLRSNDYSGTPSESVTKSKIKKIIYTASKYINDFNLYDTAIRFDIVEIFNQTEKINHIENAFDADLSW